jgi:hypothetical protein
LIGEHKKFYDYISPYTRKLEALTYRLQKQLPAYPPDDWQQEDEEIFREKPLPYPQLVNEASDDEDGGHEVERILQMHTDWDGQVKYLVKVRREDTTRHECAHQWW